MKNELIESLKIVLCLILVLWTEISIAKSLANEDLDSLLPKIPQTTNETIAAVVEDPVIKDAVQHAAANGSLNGLVIKKKVFIMPASNPSKVLSEREQLLIVPTEHLEDVRRNITESKENETDEYSSPENQSLLENDVDEFTTEKSENGWKYKSHELEFFSEDDPTSSAPMNNDLKTGNEFLEGMLTQGTALPESGSKKVVSVPIVAVINPSNLNDDKVESSIIAVLPNREENDILKNQADFLKQNRERIQEKVQAYIDQTSLTIDPENWKSSTSSETSSLDQRTMSSLKSLEAPDIVTEELFLTPVIVPSLEMVAPVFQAPNDEEYLRNIDDMDVAEDIIFRPLFKYRQEAQQRSKYPNDEITRRRSNYRRYNPYRAYNSYPRRDYRYKPRYDNYYE